MCLLKRMCDIKHIRTGNDFAYFSLHVCRYFQRGRDDNDFPLICHFFFFFFNFFPVGGIAREICLVCI